MTSLFKRLKILEKWDRLRSPVLWLVIISLMGLYSLLFPYLIKTTGIVTRPLGYIYVILAALFFGVKGGVLFALLFVLLNTLLHNQIGLDMGTEILGPILSVSIAVLIGHLRNVSLRLKTEIEEHRQRVEALEESEAKFKGIFGNTKNGVAEFQAENNGEDFVFSDINNAVERIVCKEREAHKSLNNSNIHDR